MNEERKIKCVILERFGSLEKSRIIEINESDYEVFMKKEKEKKKKFVYLEELTTDSIGKIVEYTPKGQKGTITSFNSRFVFVCYDGTGRGNATNAEDLFFVD